MDPLDQKVSKASLGCLVLQEPEVSQDLKDPKEIQEPLGSLATEERLVKLVSRVSQVDLVMMENLGILDHQGILAQEGKWECRGHLANR